MMVSRGGFHHQVPRNGYHGMGSPRSSVGQSSRLLSGRSVVRIHPRAFVRHCGEFDFGCCLCRAAIFDRPLL